MKKIITSLLFSFLTIMCVAQNDTLLFEPFDADPVTNLPNFVDQAAPPGVTNDGNWYNYDSDGLNDASGQGRPGYWFWQSGGFADIDSTDGCMTSNSWTNDPVTPVENYLVTPAIDILDATARVHWEAAPYQTPRYLDGYKVMVSTTNNDIGAFTDEIYRAAEMTTWINDPNDPPDSNYSSFSFDPSGAYIHGLDQTFIEYHDDSLRHRGVQQDTSVSLAAYSGQTIYIAFVHYTHDDNLLSLDDILVTGTLFIGYNDLTRDPMKVYAFPNPANRNTTLNFTLDKPSGATLKIMNTLGRQVYQRQVAGIAGKNSLNVNVEDFAAGTYFYTVTSQTATSSGKFSVVR